MALMIFSRNVTEFSADTSTILQCNFQGPNSLLYEWYVQLNRLQFLTQLLSAKPSHQINYLVNENPHKLPANIIRRLHLILKSHCFTFFRQSQSYLFKNRSAADFPILFTFWSPKTPDWFILRSCKALWKMSRVFVKKVIFQLLELNGWQHEIRKRIICIHRVDNLFV